MPCAELSNSHRGKYVIRRVVMDRLNIAVGMLLFSFAAAAHEEEADTDIVPGNEYATANKLGLEGPSETQGVAPVEELGSISLAGEFSQLDGQQFRVREITIEPGGVVAVHRHQNRPGFAYILEGEIIEHRNDHPEPILRKVGDVAVEKTGVAHWWENKSGAIVRALVIDIITVDSQ